ncbi:hypothetical protein J2W23_001647 [Variovorax boronicumulans]|uniref:DUF3237 domain-containing protein n=1 Tax=Variovorax boronicumulans TaxID=436515 RepID=UPI00159D921F|nr:DUF3237 domain-containing protein [Variovorax boronicumulans]MDQ0013268.1 hypothetical protein [Variovorax boronicumulans]
MSAILDKQALFEQPLLEAMPVRHLCDLRVDLETPIVVPTPRGTLVPYIGKGGRLDGPKLRGEFLPGSVDWVAIGADGISRLDIRGAMRTHDGALVYFESKGVAKLPADGRARLAKGERLAFSETYLRTTPKLETSDERYAWLNGLVLIGYNELSAGRIDFRIYQVL